MSKQKLMSLNEVGDIENYLADFEHGETLIYYDGELSGTFISKTDPNVICYRHAVDFEYNKTEDNHVAKDRYMLFLTTPEKVEELKENKIKMYDFIYNQLSDEVVFVDICYDNGKNYDRYFKATKDSITDDYYPTKDCYLNFEPEEDE